MPIFLRWFLNLAITNPIAVRLVQNGSRRVRHLYIRSAYLAVLIVALLWLLLTSTSAGALSYRDLASAAAGAFTFIAYLQILLICILAPIFMGGAISQEGSPRTWEVLLTTPLSASQIVLGNLFGRLFFVLALLLASLPLFALTQYFGGVPGSAIFLSYAIAGCAALLVGAIAIALAVSRMAGKRAFFVFYVAVVSYLFVTAAVDAYLARAGLGYGGGNVTMLTATNPFLTLRALLNPSSYVVAPPGTYTGIKSWFLGSPVTTWCVGSGLLSLASMVASAVTVRAGGLQTLARMGEEGGVPWYRQMFGLGAAGAEHRPPRSVWTNPIAWREAAARNATFGRIVARWSFVAMGGVFGFVLVWFYHDGTLSHEDFRLALAATAWGETAVIALVAINMAGTAISREREDGTLDILLTTPVTASAYLTGKLRGLIAYLLPMLAVPVGTLVIAGAYVGSGGFGRAGGVTVTTTLATAATVVPVVIPEAGLWAGVVLVPFAAFCVMVGLNQSLRSRGTIGSVVATVGIVGAFAAVVGLCGWQAAAEIPGVGPALGAMSPASLIAATTRPEVAMQTMIGKTGLGSARVSLAFGAIIAAGLYAVICYVIHGHIVRTFDMTVRKMAGQR
jgi:ABC-type transport system involved in multi-copper enzyme maturation permease subunit